MNNSKGRQNGWRNATDFNGVASRYEFWSFLSVSVGICLLPLFCWWLALMANPAYGVFIFFALPLSVLLGLLFLIPVLAIGVRRMHDIGYSGWWFIAAVLTIWFIPVILLICCMKSRTTSES